jgi:hypothetical protein
MRVYHAIHCYFVLHTGCGNDSNQNVASKQAKPHAKTGNGNAEEFSAHSTTDSSTEQNTVSTVTVPNNPNPAHGPPVVFPLSRRGPPVGPKKNVQSHSTVSRSSDMSEKRSRLGAQPGAHTAPASAFGTVRPGVQTSGSTPPSTGNSPASARRSRPLGGVVTTQPSVHSSASTSRTTGLSGNSDSSDDSEAPPTEVQPEEVPFTDEFDESDAAGHPRAVPDAPVVDAALFGLNLIGRSILAGREPDQILAQFPRVLEANVDRNTGQYVARYGGNHMQFWAQSNGPVLLQSATDFFDCGIDVTDVNSQKTLCYLLMMLATSVPFDPQTYKPRDVARHIGLTQFCEINADGIRIELQNRSCFG